MNSRSQPKINTSPEDLVQPLSAEEVTELRKRSISVRTLLWVGAILFLLMLHFWFPSLSPGSKYDTHSTSLSGKKAFYLLMNNKLDTVYRNDRTIVWRSFNTMKTYKTLCFLGPMRYPNEQEWTLLLDWVARGGNLVMAAHAESSKELNIKQLNIVVKKSSFRIDFNQDVEADFLDNKTEVYWESDAVITAPQAATLLKTPGGLQAVTQRHGAGTVTVTASDRIFTNESLHHHDNGFLAMQLVQTEETTSIYEVDEGLNLSAIPKVVGLFLEIPFRPLFILFLMLILLYCWWQHFRFGPLQSPALLPRKNIVDHTDAVGMMYYRSKAGNAAVRAYLKQLIDQIKLKAAKGREHRVLDPIAARMNSSSKELMKLLNSIAHDVRKTHIDRDTASQMIQDLAEIRQASVSRKKK